ncbi:hypothetical protein [Chamaesiphon minutus]|uniref:hypothetical protein n=1 Tax=Chamaesiphon minutus TaxID=1173032 RepID=UPI0002E7BC9B|nr:hypothetical protein [Chamaesiphon minutus]
MFPYIDRIDGSHGENRPLWGDLCCCLPVVGRAPCHRSLAEPLSFPGTHHWEILSIAPLICGKTFPR